MRIENNSGQSPSYDQSFDSALNAANGLDAQNMGARYRAPNKSGVAPNNPQLNETWIEFGSPNYLVGASSVSVFPNPFLPSTHLNISLQGINTEASSLSIPYNSDIALSAFAPQHGEDNPPLIIYAVNNNIKNPGEIRIASETDSLRVVPPNDPFYKPEQIYEVTSSTGNTLLSMGSLNIKLDNNTPLKIVFEEGITTQPQGKAETETAKRNKVIIDHSIDQPSSTQP